MAGWLHSIQSDFSQDVSRDGIEALIRYEIASQQRLLRAWREWFDLDVLSLHLGNVLLKRVVYTHKPYFYRAPWRCAFPVLGVNTRQHLAVDDGFSPRSTRFEAISELRFQALPSYYAFKVQYRQDATGRVWQVLSPSLLLDERVCDLIIGLEEEERRKLLTSLRLLLSFASHDYVHSTMMRWFSAPTLTASPQYSCLMSETGPPRPLADWHAALARSRQVRLRSGEVRNVRDILEYQAAYVHLRNLERLFRWDESSLAVVVRLSREIDRVLAGTVAGRDPSDDRVAHLSDLVIWLLLGILRLDPLRAVLDDSGFTHLTADRATATAEGLFWGFYDTVNGLDEGSFMWDGEFRDIRVPFVHYGASLLQIGHARCG